MEELLKLLDEKMKALIDKYQRLKVSNLELNQSKFVMGREKDLLLTKQHTAVKQIEDLISKLKNIEKLT